MRVRPSFALPITALLLLSSVRPLHAAWPHDPSVNLRVAGSAFGQDQVKIASDGSGGFFLTWQQASASTGLDVYAQHITAAGAVAPGWPAAGYALYGGSGDQTNPVVMPDGVGGAYFAWEDKRSNGVQRDIYLTRLAADGSIPSGWIAGGTAMQFDGRDEYTPQLVSDGSGGAFVIWTLVFSGSDTDLYGAHFLATGTRDWGAAGLVAPSGFQSAPSVVQDGAGGFIFSYIDETSGLGKDVRAARFNSGGFQQFNITVRAQAGDQFDAVAVADGEGGAIIAYLDNNTGPTFAFASRITATGAFAPNWASTGNLVCAAANTRSDLAIIPDGSHGAIIGWQDTRTFADVYAQHLNAFAKPQWVSNGTPVSTVVSFKSGPAMAPDGSGGAVLAWYDSRDGGGSIYAERVTVSGSVAPNWTAGGSPIHVVFNNSSVPVIAADNGTAFAIAWRDDRATPSQIYAQRVERFGVLGNPEPAITSVKDVIQDQGGNVRLTWDASWIDADPMYGVGNYWVWRQVPTTTALAAIARGATWLAAADAEPAPKPTPRPAASRGLYMPALDGATGYSWEFLASLPASGFPSYSYVAATTTDSMPSGNPRTAFLLQARGVSGGAYWNSAPDSGYSVDNLAPAMPAPFTGAYLSGSTALHWGRNTEADLANYRLYRGTSSGFVPGAGNLIASPPDTGYVDPGGTPYFYKLSAVDVHGNESPFALLTPNATLDSPEPAAARRFALVPQPSPARGPMVMSFSLPRATEFSLAIFDAGGRRVLDLARGRREAGDYRLPWDGRDGAGRELPSGLYFARLEAPGRSLAVRFVRMR